MNIKAGILSSEFWLTLIPMLVSIGVISGVVGGSDTDYVISLAKDVVSGVIALVTLVTYIISRTNLKREAIKSVGSTDTPVTPELQPVESVPAELG